MALLHIPGVTRAPAAKKPAALTAIYRSLRFLDRHKPGRHNGPAQVGSS